MTEDKDGHNVQDNPSEVHLTVASPASSAVERKPGENKTLGKEYNNENHSYSILMKSNAVLTEKLFKSSDRHSPFFADGLEY